MIYRGIIWVRQLTHICQKDQQLSKTVPGLQTSLKSVSKILKLSLNGNVFAKGPLHNARHFIQCLVCPGWRHWARQFCITSCFKWGWYNPKLSSYAWVIVVLLRWTAFYIENHPLLSRCSVESTLPRTAIPRVAWQLDSIKHKRNGRRYADNILNCFEQT